MGEKLHVNFSIDKKKAVRNVVLVLAIIAVFMLAYYLHKTEPTLPYSELAKITTGAFVVIGLIYSIMTYELTQKKNRHDVKMQKSAATHAACSEWYSSNMMNHSKTLTELRKSPLFALIATDIKEFENQFNDDSNEKFKVAFLCIFNYFESLSIASNEGLMDEEFIKKYFLGVFKRFYKDYLPIILSRRISRQDVNLMVDFTTLVEKWQTNG